MQAGKADKQPPTHASGDTAHAMLDAHAYKVLDTSSHSCCSAAGEWWWPAPSQRQPEGGCQKSFKLQVEHNTIDPTTCCVTLPATMSPKIHYQRPARITHILYIQKYRHRQMQPRLAAQRLVYNVKTTNPDLHGYVWCQRQPCMPQQQICSPTPAAGCRSKRAPQSCMIPTLHYKH
jgi:hypothetical protein